MANIRRRRNRASKPWLVDYRDARGQRRRLAAKTREEAENLLAAKIKESRQAVPPVENPNITFNAYADQWLAQIASSVDDHTLTSYRNNLRRYIRPAFGHLMVRSVHRAHIKTLLAKKRGDGLSKNSVRLIRATLSVMFSDAMDDGIVTANPALGINRRGRKRPDTITQADRQKQIRAMTYDELATFLTVATSRCSQRRAALFLLLADAGLRPVRRARFSGTTLISTI